jgi:hypothetical protein
MATDKEYKPRLNLGSNLLEKTESIGKFVKGDFSIIVGNSKKQL